MAKTAREAIAELRARWMKIRCKDIECPRTGDTGDCRFCRRLEAKRDALEELETLLPKEE